MRIRIHLDTLAALVLVAVAAVHHFGWLDGLGLTAAAFLLMPHAPAT